MDLKFIKHDAVDEIILIQVSVKWLEYGTEPWCTIKEFTCYFASNYMTKSEVVN